MDTVLFCRNHRAFVWLTASHHLARGNVMSSDAEHACFSLHVASVRLYNTGDARDQFCNLLTSSPRSYTIDSED